MSKIRVLADHVANQIAAGEVVERPASVAKELVENAIDAAATRITIDIEGGGRRLLKVTDDGEGMIRDDALLAFERHATSKISGSQDLAAIATLGFRGEALASIASVAKVELVTRIEDVPAATRVVIEGGRMRDVRDAAHPRGTTIVVRDLFFNVPARRKFLRSEATETFHLTNLVTHYALAHPEIAFTLTNNGREAVRASPAKDLRERAYQIFGPEFLENLLEVNGGYSEVARIRGFVSAPRDRRTSRDAQYLFVNGRFVRDRLIARALSEGYRSILPRGVYPAALLFIETPLEEVDVNVHPAKTEVRFRRAAAVSDAVREAVRAALASNGYVEERPVTVPSGTTERMSGESGAAFSAAACDSPSARTVDAFNRDISTSAPPPRVEQSRIDFARTVETFPDEEFVPDLPAIKAPAEPPENPIEDAGLKAEAASSSENVRTQAATRTALPPLASAEKFVGQVTVDSLSPDIRPLGQLEESFIVAIDDEGLLLIDQHVAHERILFDKYRALEATRRAESQNLLVPETFDLTPAQTAVFELVSEELENYGFELMRLSGRTVAIKATPADLPAGEARNMLAEILDSVELEKRGSARETLRDEIAASLACHAAIKVNTPLAPEKMRWLIDRLLLTSSPTTCPHGRPVILRLTTRDILKGFHRI
ncbi:MAG TPA: DNA mismatch repair endonuclease MutL [Pyrinomonadaceae bacterium]|nr:DNA mismatch repair endonuclease MutL [Pyrinomonadaceae bacterium]